MKRQKKKKSQIKNNKTPEKRAKQNIDKQNTGFKTLVVTMLK